MAGNEIKSGFVSVDNLISEVLYAINDMEKRKYYALALQKIINTIRNIYVNHSGYYEETPIELDENLRTGQFPSDLVKAISVGVYKNGEFVSFTRKSEMARTTTGLGEGYDEDFNENEDIPRRGIVFGAHGHNIAYWIEDEKWQ